MSYSEWLEFRKVYWDAKREYGHYRAASIVRGLTPLPFIEWVAMVEEMEILQSDLN
jgi:hypothetical protein